MTTTKANSTKAKPASRPRELAKKTRSKTVPTPQEPPSGRVTHQSLERGLQVLETIAATGSLISLGEASRRTGLHRSTTHHLLQSLVGVGYVRQDKKSRGYELTSKLFELTGRMWTPEQIGRNRPAIRGRPHAYQRRRRQHGRLPGRNRIDRRQARRRRSGARGSERGRRAPNSRNGRRQGHRGISPGSRTQGPAAAASLRIRMRHGPSPRKRRSPPNFSASGSPAAPMMTKSIWRVFDASPHRYSPIPGARSARSASSDRAAG